MSNFCALVCFVHIIRHDYLPVHLDQVGAETHLVLVRQQKPVALLQLCISAAILFEFPLLLNELPRRNPQAGHFKSPHL